MKSKAYRGVSVNGVDLEAVLRDRERQAVHVGLDIGKLSIFCVLRWKDRDFAKPWKVDNPADLGALVERLAQVGAGRAMTIAMEPTGTYGDALRQALADRGLKACRVSPKAAKDYAEIFDGVPSQHDGKDAAVVAELSALGRSWPWDFIVPNVRDQEIKYRVDAIDWERRQMMREVGRLEGLLSRHWPEATRLLKVNSATLLKALIRYGSPAKLAADPKSLEQLRRWGRHGLSVETAAALAASARTTSGVRVDSWSERALVESATAIAENKRRIASHTRGLVAVSQGNEVIERQSVAVGVATACVLWRHLGNPGKYHCGAAYRKAMGLNLKERSSGQWQGQLAVSKRGSPEVRRWLYLAALRLLQSEPSIRAWYAEQKRRRQGVGKPAVVGVMRKLALVLYQIGAKEETYASTRVFDALTATGAATGAAR